MTRRLPASCDGFDDARGRASVTTLSTKPAGPNMKIASRIGAWISRDTAAASSRVAAQHPTSRSNAR
jgi:hypothetical protein